MSAPANDLFVNAFTITGSGGYQTGSNVDATSEYGEPGNNGKTVWWKWYCATTGLYEFSTDDMLYGARTEFASKLQVFTPNNPSSPTAGTLTEMEYAQDASGGIGWLNGALVQFYGTANTYYWVRVDVRSTSVASGRILLTWKNTTFTLGACGSPFAFAANCVASATVPLPPNPAGVARNSASFGYLPQIAGFYFAQYGASSAFNPDATAWIVFNNDANNLGYNLYPVIVAASTGFFYQTPCQAWYDGAGVNRNKLLVGGTGLTAHYNGTVGPVSKSDAAVEIYSVLINDCLDNKIVNVTKTGTNTYSVSFQFTNFCPYDFHNTHNFGSMGGTAPNEPNATTCTLLNTGGVSGASAAQSFDLNASSNYNLTFTFTAATFPVTLTFQFSLLGYGGQIVDRYSVAPLVAAQLYSVFPTTCSGVGRTNFLLHVTNKGTVATSGLTMTIAQLLPTTSSLQIGSEPCGTLTPASATITLGTINPGSTVSTGFSVLDLNGSTPVAFNVSFSDASGSYPSLGVTGTL